LVDAAKSAEIRTVEVYRCSDCAIEFIGPDSLLRHKSTVHGFRIAHNNANMIAEAARQTMVIMATPESATVIQDSDVEPDDTSKVAADRSRKPKRNVKKNTTVSRRRRISMSAARAVADTAVPLRAPTRPDKVFAPPAKRKIVGAQIRVVSAEQTSKQDMLEDVINRVAKGQTPASDILISNTVSAPSEVPIETISTSEIIQAVEERPRDRSGDIADKFLAKRKLPVGERRTMERMAATAMATRSDVANKINRVLAHTPDADLRLEFIRLSKELSVHPQPKLFE